MPVIVPSCVATYKNGRTGLKHTDINKRLRSGKYGNGDTTFAEIDRVIGQIRNVINNQPYTGNGGIRVQPTGHNAIQPGTILYRGIAPQTSGIFAAGNTPQINNVYVDKGFLSTSAIYSVSKGFAMPRGFLLTITIRNVAANVIDFRLYGKDYDGEGEILFDRSTRIVVDNAVWNGTTNLCDVACHIG
jgi:hypothetical protein